MLSLGCEGSVRVSILLNDNPQPVFLPIADLLAYILDRDKDWEENAKRKDDDVGEKQVFT